MDNRRYQVWSPIKEVAKLCDWNAAFVCSLAFTSLPNYFLQWYLLTNISHSPLSPLSTPLSPSFSLFLPPSPTPPPPPPPLPPPPSLPPTHHPLLPTQWGPHKTRKRTGWEERAEPGLGAACKKQKEYN